MLHNGCVGHACTITERSQRKIWLGIMEASHSSAVFPDECRLNPSSESCPVPSDDVTAIFHRVRESATDKKMRRPTRRQDGRMRKRYNMRKRRTSQRTSQVGHVAGTKQTENVDIARDDDPDDEPMELD